MTRALETAIYIARETSLEILVEPFFHEWRPDLSGKNSSAKEAAEAARIFEENDGLLPKTSPYLYETAEQVKSRFLDALEKYRTYDTAIVVSHGMLMRQFANQEKIDFCETIEVNI